jgi:hypothetical protein
MIEIMLDIDKPGNSIAFADSSSSNQLSDAFKRQSLNIKQEPYMNSLARAMSTNPNEAYISWQQQQQQNQMHYSPSQQYNQVAMILAQQQQQSLNQALKAGIKSEQIYNDTNQHLPHDPQSYSNLPGPNQQLLDLQKIQVDSKYTTETESQCSITAI